MDGHTPAKLERLVAELSLQPGIHAVQWYAGEHSSTAELSIARQGRACSSGAAAASRSPRLPVSGG